MNSFIQIPENTRSNKTKYKNLNLNLIFSYQSVDYNKNIGLRSKDNPLNNFIWGVEFIDISKEPIEILFDNKEDRDKFFQEINLKLT